MNCTSETCIFIFSQLFPTFGVLTSTALYTSPLKLILTIEATKSFGSYNPIAAVLMFLNSMVWILYSFIASNYYVFFGNIFGALIGAYAIFTVSFVGGFQTISESPQPLDLETASPVTATEEPQLIEKSHVKNLNFTKKAFIFGLAFILFGGLFSFITVEDLGEKKTLMGLVANVILIFFYTSPLSGLFEVIKTKNASGLYLPVVFATLINTILWLVYGIAINDVFIWLPNSSGMLVAVAQLFCKSIYSGRTLPNSRYSNL